MIQILIGIFPVFLFLTALVFLDSYKLISLRSIVIAILAGTGTAWIVFGITSVLLPVTHMEAHTYSRYVAPVIEESIKAGYILFLIQSKRIGFMVDAAIYGFAVGAGFAAIENIYYMYALDNPELLLWIIRGFGTAIMHGGTMAIFGIVAKNLSDRFPGKSFLVIIPPLLITIVIHSLFNHAFLPPILETIVLLLLLPTLLIIIFKQSEESTRTWLGVGLDADMELLHLITTGNLSESNIGKYLHSLREKFPPAMIVDMLCLLRIHTELALRSKGILMMRQTGFTPDEDPEIVEKFNELTYLEKNLGTTGKLAIAPFLHTTSRDLWQIYMLKT